MVCGYHAGQGRSETLSSSPKAQLPAFFLYFSFPFHLRNPFHKPPHLSQTVLQPSMPPLSWSHHAQPWEHDEGPMVQILTTIGVRWPSKLRDCVTHVLTVHLWGFSPVCLLMCTTNIYWALKGFCSLEQSNHRQTNSFFSPWIWSLFICWSLEKEREKLSGNILLISEGKKKKC